MSREREGGQARRTIDGDTAPVRLGTRELGHKVAGDLAEGVTSSPNDKTAGDLDDALVRHLKDNALLLDLLDHGPRQDIDLGLLEC